MQGPYLRLPGSMTLPWGDGYLRQEEGTGPTSERAWSTGYRYWAREAAMFPQNCCDRSVRHSGIVLRGHLGDGIRRQMSR